MASKVSFLPRHVPIPRGGQQVARWLAAACLVSQAYAYEREDQPCTTTVYPSFIELPPAQAVENLPVPDPTGIGARWHRLIQTALRPDPKDFSWYSEYGTWACRYQQTDLVLWQRFPAETNAKEIVGTLVRGRLLIAPAADLVVQGMNINDPQPFTLADLELAERSPHPVPGR